MNPDLAAFALIFQLCYGKLCKMEPYDPPCMVTVVVMEKVRTDPTWWKWEDRNLHVMKTQTVVNICKGVPHGSRPLPKAK